MPSFALLRRSPKRPAQHGTPMSAETTEDEGSGNGSPKSPQSPSAGDAQQSFGQVGKKARVSTRELLYEIRSRLVGKPPPSPLRTPQRGRAVSQPQTQRGYAASVVRQLPAFMPPPLTYVFPPASPAPARAPSSGVPLLLAAFHHRVLRGSRIRVGRPMHSQIASLLFQLWVVLSGAWRLSLRRRSKGYLIFLPLLRIL